MSRRGSWLAAGLAALWLCLFLHWETTEKSMIRALLVEQNREGWTVGLLYQFPEASADSSEAQAGIRLCIGRGPELSAAVTSAENALPQRADWRLCEYLLAEQESAQNVLSACEETYVHQPYGRLASRVFGAAFSLDALEEAVQASESLPEALLQCVKTAAPSAPRLYEQSRGVLLPVVELEKESAQCQPEALVLTAEHTGRLTTAQTEMALLLQGRSWTNAGKYRFEKDSRSFHLRHPVCGVERKGETFVLRVDALSRDSLPTDSEQALEALCVETVSRCWVLGLDIAGLGAAQELVGTGPSLTTKNVCPVLRADVTLYWAGI